MKLNVTEALHNPGRNIKFAFTKQWPSIVLNGDVVEFTNPMEAWGTCLYSGEGFFVRGSFNVDYRIRCAKCTQDFDTSIEADFSEEYSKEYIEQHPDRYIFEGDTILLDKMLMDNIHLQAPTRHVCRPECKGLCFVCGADLNVTDCGCDDKIDDNNPFNVLKDLFKDEEV